MAMIRKLICSWMLTLVGSLVFPVTTLAAVSGTMFDVPSTTTTAPATIAEHTTAVVPPVDIHETDLRGMVNGQTRSLFGLSHGVIAPGRGAGTSRASSVNAQAVPRSKLSALENARNTAARMRTLPDGRIRYYGAETSARTAGPTRGASYVTEYNPRTGQVRSWMESYDHAGNVTRVHPKMINGQTVNAPHYPPTGRELGQ